MKVLNRNEFWESMCSQGFYRSGTHQGWDRGQLLVTFDPPDNDLEFLSKTIDGILTNLNINPLTGDIGSSSERVLLFSLLLTSGVMLVGTWVVYSVLKAFGWLY